MNSTHSAKWKLREEKSVAESVHEGSEVAGRILEDLGIEGKVWSGWVWELAEDILGAGNHREGQRYWWDSRPL